MTKNRFSHITQNKKVLRSVARIFRESGIVTPEEFEEVWKELLDHLRLNDHDRHRFHSEISRVMLLEGFREVLCESNINNHTSFWQEFFARIRHRILPKLRSENTFRFRLKRIFDFEKDEVWLRFIGESHIRSLIGLPGFNTIPGGTLQHEILDAIRIISVRISAIGMDDRMNIRDRNSKEHQDDFFRLPVLTNAFIIAVQENDQQAEIAKDNIRAVIDRCQRYIIDVKASFRSQGANVDKAFSVIKCDDLLHRLEDLLNIVQPGNQDRIAAVTNVSTAIIKEEANQEGIGDFFKENLKDLSLRISEHASNTGEHYIADGFKDYYNFLFAAIGAGFIVSFLVFVKVWLHHLNAPGFWEAILYSLNYAIGFVLIQVFHFTLATKQPAMTASAISRSLGSDRTDHTIPELGITIARVFHTQTISFIGNLLIVFPVPFILSWLLDAGFDYQLYKTPEAALKVMDGQHPWRSGALWYAAITGFYLFISGIVAGYVDNRVIYSKIPQRVRQLRLLHNVAGFKNTVKFSKYLENNAGGLAGNITLGFLLGTATFIGTITGLPFDIRHITFAAGTFTSALYFAGNEVIISDIIIITLGILLIGFVNFTVSFGMAFYLACKSRDISIRDTPELLQFLLRYLRKYPADFVRAPLKPRTPEDILN